MNKHETPDAYITRHEMELEPSPPPEEDRCYVCGKFECVCPLENPESTDPINQKEQMNLILLIPSIIMFAMAAFFVLAKSYAAAVWMFGAALCFLAMFLKSP